MFKNKKRFTPSGVRSTKSRGFTLIELLVVIAIIGLLAGIVLVSLGSTRNQARDGRVIAEMGQIRTQAEIYNSAVGNYTGFDCDNTVAPISTLCDDITAQGGNAPVFNISGSGNDYCVEVDMNDGWYCIDNTFVAQKFTDAVQPACSPSFFKCNP